MRWRDFVKRVVQNALFPGGAYWVPAAARAAWLRALEAHYPGEFAVEWDPVAPPRPDGPRRVRPRPGRPHRVSERLERAAGRRYPSLRAPRLYASVDEYLERNRDRMAGSNPAPWPSETAFVREVFFPAAGLDALNHLVPQYPVPLPDGRSHAVDFVYLGGGRPVALEVEGTRFHGTVKEALPQHVRDTELGSELQEQGFRVERFVWDRIRKDPAGCVRRLRRALGLPEDQAPGDGVDEGAAPYGFFAVEWESFLPRVTEVFLELLEGLGESEGKGPARVLDLTDSYGLAALAWHELRTVVHHLAELWDVTPPAAPLPEVRVELREADRPFFHRVWDEYAELLWEDLGAEMDPGVYPDPPALLDRQPLFPSPGAPPADGGYDLVLTRDLVPAFASAAEMGRFLAGLEARLSEGGRCVLLESRPGGGPRNRRDIGRLRDWEPEYPSHVDIGALKYFLYRYFGFTTLRDGQTQLLDRALSGRNLLGILPTGAGKSLCFQLPALLVPGMTLVVSPLKSLMFDQEENLRNGFGLHCVGRISSDQTREEKAEVYRRAAAGELKLLYVSPERLLMRGFEQELLGLSGRPLAYFVVDEAHCVSEWGHDFRPAYLSIAQLVSSLNSRRNWRVPVLALTATASAMVRADILRLLRLSADDLPSFPTMNRPNLSFQVLPVAAENQRLDALRGFLEKSGEDVFRVNHPGKAPSGFAGIIFAPYADPTGVNNRHLGTTALARALRDSGYEAAYYHSQDKAEEADVPACPRCFSSGLRMLSTHYVCPGCGLPYSGSGDWVRPIRENGWRCTGCGRKYESARRDDLDKVWCEVCGWSRQGRGLRVPKVPRPGWEEEKQSIHRAFKAGTLARIVATRGFGMGIDKPDIRYVFHAAPPTSLEGYYQEAGRAGRDGAHAHCTLLYRPPAKGCEGSRRTGALPGCVFGESYQFWKCPVDRHAGICDFNRDLRFVLGEELKEVLEKWPDDGQGAGILERLKKEWLEALAGRFDELFRTVLSPRRKTVDDGPDAKGLELLVVRCRQIGLLEGYNVEYPGPPGQPRRLLLEYPERWEPGRLAECTVKSAASLYEESGRERAGEDVRRSLPEEVPGKPVDALAMACFRELCSRFFDQVWMAKLRMPFTVREYVERRECRKATLLSYFDLDGERLPVENCRMCDVCVPDLAFPPLAEVPALGAAGRLGLDADAAARAVEAFRARRDALLDGPFSPAEIARFVEGLGPAERRYLRPSLARRLESAPGPAAYFMRGCLDRETEPASAPGFFELSLGLDPGRVRGLPWEGVLDTLAGLDPARAFRFLERLLAADPAWGSEGPFRDRFRAWAPSSYRKKALLERLCRAGRDLLDVAQDVEGAPASPRTSVPEFDRAP